MGDTKKRLKRLEDLAADQLTAGDDQVAVKHVHWDGEEDYTEKMTRAEYERRYGQRTRAVVVDWSLPDEDAKTT